MIILAGAVVNLTSEKATGTAVPSTAVQVGFNSGGNLTVPICYTGTQGMSAGSVGLYVANLELRSTRVNGTGGTYRVEGQNHRSTTGVNANGAGTAEDCSGSGFRNFSFMVIRTAGASAYVVDFEGSLDGTNYVTIDTISASGASNMIHIANKPLRYYRYNVTTIGAGNTLTIQMFALR